MDLDHMTKSPLKILLNAESFGFGPAAATSQIARVLKPYFQKTGYIGSAHTQDLQKSYIYDEIIDLTSYSEEKKMKIFKQTASQYDIFLTTLDFKMASLAAQAGLKVIIYDPLLWYWSDDQFNKEILPVLKNVDLYFVQDFIGVKETVQHLQEVLPKTIVIPAIVEDVLEKSSEPDKIVVNLGGISNPLWDYEVGASYVNSILEAFKPIPKNIFFGGSKRYEEVFVDLPSNIKFKTYSPDEMLETMQTSEIIFITPGLGNIYEAAATKKHVVLLPPVNDSQGQQAKLLQEANLTDQVIDWKDITNEDIDYFKNQEIVLNDIKNAIYKLGEEKNTQAKLAQIINNSLTNKQTTNLYKLIEQFGHDGLKVLSEELI